MFDEITLVGTGQEPLTFPGKLIVSADGRFHDTLPDQPNRAWFAISVYRVPPLAIYDELTREVRILYDCEFARRSCYDPDAIARYVIAVTFHEFADGEWREVIDVGEAERVEEFFEEGFWPSVLTGMPLADPRLQSQLDYLIGTVSDAAYVERQLSRSLNFASFGSMSRLAELA